MEIYGDDQCVECGGIRVAGSELCADCCVKLLAIRLQEIERLEGVKKELEEKNQKLTKLVERLLDHITNTVAHTSELERTIYLAWLQKKRRNSDGKDRLQNNKEK